MYWISYPMMEGWYVNDVPDDILSVVPSFSGKIGIYVNMNSRKKKIRSDFAGRYHFHLYIRDYPCAGESRPGTGRKR